MRLKISTSHLSLLSAKWKSTQLSFQHQLLSNHQHTIFTPSTQCLPSNHSSSHQSSMNRRLSMRDGAKAFLPNSNNFHHLPNSKSLPRCNPLCLPIISHIRSIKSDCTSASIVSPPSLLMRTRRETTAILQATY